jgi:hypothetical protein
LKSRVKNELCQEQRKCRQTHHRLLHVDAEGERSPQTARPAKPAEPPDRLRRSLAYSRAKASRDVSTGSSEVAATQQKSRKRGSGAEGGRRAAIPVAVCAGVRVMPVTSAARETAQLAEASEGEATRRRSGNGRPQQQQRAAGKQQTAAGGCERERIGQVASTAHEKQPADRNELQRACQEIWELYSNILGMRQGLSRILGRGDSADAIESRRGALLSEVERIEGAAARGAQTRGWDLNEIEDLVQEMLAETQCTLREADSTLYERKAAHHAARVEVLAGEASEVDGTKCWSRQDCTVFRKELDWELQAFSKANTELELPSMRMDKRLAAHLRAEKVDAAAHYARQVVEKVLWYHDCGWEESQRFGLDHHQPIRPEESCEQGGRQGVQAGSVADGEGGPQRVVQMEDEIWALQKWYPPREAEVDSGGWPEESRLGTQRPGQANQLTWRGIGSERPRKPRRSCWAPSRSRKKRPVNLDYRENSARLRGSWRSSEVSTKAHRKLGGDDSSRTRHHADLHRNEDRHTEAVEDKRPRPHGASSEALREQVLQGGEREGWPGSCKRAQRQVDLSRRAGTAVSKKRRLPSGSKRSSEAKRRPAQRLSCEARTYGFVYQREAASEAAQGEQSGCQEDATPTAAEKGESGDESDLLTEDRDRAGLRGSADRGSYRSLGWDPGGLLMGA